MGFLLGFEGPVPDAVVTNGPRSRGVRPSARTPRGYCGAMRAVTWQGHRTVSVETVPDPVIKEPTDAIIKVTSSGLCGSDLHLYETLGPFMTPGDIVGHEPFGMVVVIL